MAHSQSSKTVIGVGIDTHRYFHQATFLGADRQRAVPNLRFAESAEGYAQLRQALEKIAARQPDVHFQILVDAAGQYAANLERYLRGLPFSFTFSVGEPARNKHYRQAISPKRADDVSDSYACGRFAIAERPNATFEVPEAFQVLREIASRLESQARQTTRASNALHNLMSRVFPELATLVSSFKAEYLLVFAVWKTDKPFDPDHYAWDKAAPKQAAQQETAGRKRDMPAKEAITAAEANVEAADAPVKQAEPLQTANRGGWVDFAWLRQQITLEQVLSQAGCLDERHHATAGVAKPPKSRGRCRECHNPVQSIERRSFSGQPRTSDYGRPARRTPDTGRDVASRASTALDLAATFHISPFLNREEEPVSLNRSSAIPAKETHL
jgi:hypothetical protein